MDQFECVELQEEGAEAVVKFKDRKMTDPTRIEKLGRELSTIADDQKRVNVDFDNVKFISSAAISKLVVFEKRVRANGGKLRLTNLRPEVRDVFSLTQLDSVFNIEE